MRYSLKEECREGERRRWCSSTRRRIGHRGMTMGLGRKCCHPVVRVLRTGEEPHEADPCRLQGDRPRWRETGLLPWEVRTNHLTRTRTPHVTLTVKIPYGRPRFSPVARATSLIVSLQASLPLCNHVRITAV
jgi:hypothetical protein